MRKRGRNATHCTRNDFNFSLIDSSLFLIELGWEMYMYVTNQWSLHVHTCIQSVHQPRQRGKDTRPDRQAGSEAQTLTTGGV